MGVLGFPYPIMYEAKGLGDNLSGIYAIVQRPDGTRSANIPLIEQAPPFNGRYVGNYVSFTTDPQGYYFVYIYAATDGTFTTERFDLWSSASGGGGSGADINAIRDLLNQLLPNLNTSVLVGEIKSDSNIRAFIEPDQIPVGLLEDSFVMANINDHGLIYGRLSDEGVEGSL